MSSSSTALEELQPLQALKDQIICQSCARRNYMRSHLVALALALYGTQSSTPSTFNVFTYTNSAGGYGVALILYTGATMSPYTSWEMLSYVANQPSPVAGAETLLEDLQNGMGGVMGRLVASGECTVMHSAVPNLAAGGKIAEIGYGRLERKRWESKLEEIVEEDEG
jgi:hypothetical protein